METKIKIKNLFLATLVGGIGFCGKSQVQQITTLQQLKNIDGVHTMGVTKVVPPGFVPGDFDGGTLIINAVSTRRSSGEKCNRRKQGCLCITVEVNLDGSDLRVVTPTANVSIQSCAAEDAFVVPAGSTLFYDAINDELIFIPAQ